MRKWIMIGLAVATLATFVLINVGSSRALADFAAHPILALIQGDQRIAIQTPGQPARTGEAGVLVGQGILFGHTMTYALPDGTEVLCTQRFRTLACSDGWVAERAESPATN